MAKATPTACSNSIEAAWKARCRARRTPRDADPALDVGAGMSARGECYGSKVGADKIRTEMRLKNADQRRHIGKRDSDMMVEATGPDERGVQLRGIVTGRNDDDALSLFKTV
jgi:hypothetical protein